jgi:hypothetical protein
MPPRYRSGHQYHHPVAGYLEWEAQQVAETRAKDEAARRKHLASKARKRASDTASATANETT